MAITPGSVVDRYRIEKVIGAGSMGDVVRGEDVDLQRKVAIKILSEKHRENKELRARFVREARAVARISHPNVVQVFTTGTYDDRPYIAMELLEGVDLASLVKERGRMPSLQAARALVDAARGLDAAAKASLIHRDVKPSNLVLLDSGLVKVTDFGLAKPLSADGEPALTAMGVVVGTPDYIAPEQARGDPIDERVDIYALGGTLYFLLTGTPPFRKGNPQDDKYLKVVARHLRDPVPDARVKNSTADAELAELALRMMSKKAAQRPSYAELTEQLEAIIDRLSTEDRAGRSDIAGLETSPGLSPTPYIGGGQQALDAEPEPSDDDISDAARTVVRSSEGAAAAAVPGGTSRWLIAVTVVSALIFVAGLGLMLFGPMPTADLGASPAIDAAATAIDAVPAVQAPPTPPEGMLLVMRDGKPWLFVSREPVSHGSYAEMFPGQKKKERNKKKNARPVLEVAYVYAEAYAKGKQARLPTPAEWEAAAATEGFVPAPEGIWEWVDDGSQGVQEPRAVRAPGKQDERRPVVWNDVTFRLAVDLPSR